MRATTLQSGYLRFAAFFFLLVLATVGTAKTRRIRIKPGAASAAVTGQLRGSNDKAHFVIRIRAGQTMHVSVESKCANCNPDVEVISPKRSKDIVDPDMCQCRIEVSNTAAGDYHITVGESRKGKRWNGAFVLSISVH